MAAADWLERLNRATEYRELQVVFSEMAAAARSTSDGPRLATSIDEAIRRIEQERLRDEEELRAFEQEYESFKQQQAGVVGWLKRHLPFTETRRIERQHIDTVADHRAEVLADNLVIARAQMVKEQILPPELRRLGYEASVWRQRLGESDSVSRLRDHAVAVRELGAELLRSRAFLKEVEADIQAFGEARFSDDEDRRRKDADRSAARSEWAELQAEVQSEEALRSGAVKRLGELIEQELSAREPSFQALTERLALLETASRRAKDLESTLEQVRLAIKPLRELIAQQAAIPAERDKLARKARELRADADAAARRRVHAATNLGEHRARYEAAAGVLERAQAAANAATKADQAQRGSGPEVSAEHAFDYSPPAPEDLTRAQRTLAQAQDEVRVANAAHDAAQTEADRAEREVEKLQKELDSVRAEDDKLSERERKSRDELVAGRDRLQPTLERVQPLVGDYLTALNALGRTSSLRELLGDVAWQAGRSLSRTAFGPPSSYASSLTEHDLRGADEHHARLLTALQEEHRQLSRGLADDRKQRQEAWSARCRELLGGDLAAEVCKT